MDENRESKDVPKAKPIRNSDTSDSTKDQATILEDEIKDLPPEAQRIVRSFMFSQSRYTGPMPNPLANKINEKHIDKILDSSEKTAKGPIKVRLIRKYF